MMTTHGPRLAQDRYLDYLDARSRDVALVGVHAGYGMSTFPPGPGVFDSAQAADPDAVAPHPLTVAGRAWCEQFVPLLREQGRAVQQRGAFCFGQLHHAGVSEHTESLRPPAGPSGGPDEFRRRNPRVLSAAEIAELIEVFAGAADRVARAGLDGVEIHAGHGYLLHQFLSPLTNVRTDAYGGSADNRLRLLLEVVAAVRDAVGDSLPVGVRMPGAESAPGGLERSDLQVVARRLADAGVAYLNVSNGTYTGLRRGLGMAYVAPAAVPPGPAVSDAAAIRATSAIPVGVAGRIVDPAAAAAIVAAGEADLVGVTRALIADPQFFAKARSGRPAAINACIACNECHTGVSVRCTVNPAAGRERELAIAPSSSRRRVLVIGGGPAGLYAAAAAAARGHHVTLVEREPRLGGVLETVAHGLARRDLMSFSQRLCDEAAQQGVELITGTEVSAAMLDDLDPEDVVLALGAHEYRPPVPGIDLGHVQSALQLLRDSAVPGAARAGGHVVVVGGLEDHLPPLLAASVVARTAGRVTLLTEGFSEGEGIEAATRFGLVRSLRSGGVEVRRLSALAGVGSHSVVLRDVFSNEETTLLDVDAVILACGRRARGTEAEALVRATIPAARVHRIGDCLAPRRFLHATMDGARLAAAL